jgi:hypothetical protein
MTTLTLDGYLKLVEDARRANPSWRLGQTHFNVLYDHAPHVADKVRSTIADPFYDDTRLKAFFDAILPDLHD